MDKRLRVRLNETALSEMDRITRKLGISKKRFLEDAVHSHAQTLARSSRADNWSVGFGAWKRDETAAQTAKRVRTAFNRSLDRCRR
jgi:hypothetical protein